MKIKDVDHTVESNMYTSHLGGNFFVKGKFSHIQEFMNFLDVIKTKILIIDEKYYKLNPKIFSLSISSKNFSMSWSRDMTLEEKEKVKRLKKKEKNRKKQTEINYAKKLISKYKL